MMLDLKPCPKCSPESGIRIKPPEETLKDIIPLLGIAGMGEPEDITDKDNLGIPVFSVDRQETALGKPKYYNGKAVPGWVKNKNWYVHSLKGDRVVINESEDGKNAIMSPVNIKDLALVGAAPKETYRVHTVVKGDTLWEISAKYLGKGNRYPEIKELNNLTSNVIYSGMKLKIPN